MPISISGDGSIGPLSATEVGYLDGVTSAVQTQINSKLTTPGVWTDYSPVVTAGTGFAVGTGGTISGRYTQIGKIVHYAIDIIFGTSGVNPGNSIIQITLPVTGYGIKIHGSGWLYDSSAGTWRLCVAAPVSNTAINIGLEMAAAAGAYGVAWYNIPWTWAASDQIRISGTYEAA